MLRIGVFLMLATAGTAIAQEPSAELYIAEVKRVCSEEWGTDYDMVAYCQDKQFEAMTTIKRIFEETADDAPRAEIIQRCIQEWPAGKGYDWPMAAYCYERQVEAYNRLDQ